MALLDTDNEKLLSTALLGAILFSVGNTVEYEKLEAFLMVNREQLLHLIDEIKHAFTAVGLTIIEIAGGYRLVTDPVHIDKLKLFFTDIKESGLTKAAIETLSVIAYKQPCTRGDIEEIRGVASDSVIHGLLDKRLIKVKDRTAGPGRPYRYITTARFLELFGLKSLHDLPRIDMLDQQLIFTKIELE